MKIFIVITMFFVFIPAYSWPVDDSVKTDVIGKAMELIRLQRPREAIGILSVYKPAVKDIVSYHHTYAKALKASGKDLDSIDHLRLAYLYSPPGEAKELLLLERADAYIGIRFYSEAALWYRIFMRNFPAFRNIGRVQQGLGDALYNLGFFNEAILHYEKAGDSPQALFGKANSLQAKGKTGSAHEIYEKFGRTHRDYILSSPEVMYNAGENFRLAGKIADAKVYLSTIKAPEFKNKANFSLGLIAMDEKAYASAVKYFDMASQSFDIKLKRRALLNLAAAYTKLGKNDEAKNRLIEIKNKYPYGKDYDAALLLLAKFYKNEGKLDAALPIFKELVFRRSPEVNAINEFEAMVLEAKDKNTEEFLELWKLVGHWLLDPSRSEALLKIAKGLRPEGGPFLKLSRWLLKYGTESVKTHTRLELADFYADLGDAATASKYLKEVRIAAKNDDMLRINAKIYRLNAENKKAVETILSIRETRQEDIDVLSDMPEGIKNIQRAAAFYEKKQGKPDGTAGAYVKLADNFYRIGKKSDALKYYRIAVPVVKADGVVITEDMEWALYRVSTLSEGKEAIEALKNIKDRNDRLGRLADARLKEVDISERMKKVF